MLVYWNLLLTKAKFISHIGYVSISIILLMKYAANKRMIALNLFVELNFIKQCNQLCFANFIMIRCILLCVYVRYNIQFFPDDAQFVTGRR